MKLLICTQVVDKNDPTLGFFHRWIEEFSAHCSEVEVICLFEGTHTLPSNVKVHSLEKEKGVVSKMRYAVRFWKKLYALRGRYDAVFVHMNPEYLLLAGWWWRLTGKRIGLWYLHRAVNARLRLAVIFANVVFSVSYESFRLPTRKLQIVGMGLDPNMSAAPAVRDGGIRIITTGRIAKTKRVVDMLFALDVLYHQGIPFTFAVVGAPVQPEDFLYEKELRAAVASRPYAAGVRLLGAVPHAHIPALLREHSVFLNLSKTGSVDKAVLEALASGVPAVTSNEAFQELLSPYGLYVGGAEPTLLAAAIESAANLDPLPLRTAVLAKHSLAKLVPFILKQLTS